MQMRHKRQVGLGNGADEVLCRTPFDPLFHLRIGFTSQATSSPVRMCVRASACVLTSLPACKPEFEAVCGEETWYLLPCVAEHKSPIVSAPLPPSLSCFLSGKAVSSLGTLPLWALGSLWGVTGQPAEEATSCEM